jgi:hypothetical protein
MPRAQKPSRQTSAGGHGSRTEIPRLEPKELIDIVFRKWEAGKKASDDSRRENRMLVGTVPF